MQSGEPAGAPGPAVEDPLSRLSGTARGWHTIQLAVLGFIGICGVLRSGTDAPTAVQWLAAALAVAALAVAVLAIFLVGRVAWPLPEQSPIGYPQRVGQASARLRAGVRLTVVALALIVIAALSGWWPDTQWRHVRAGAGRRGPDVVRHARRWSAGGHQRTHDRRHRVGADADDRAGRAGEQLFLTWEPALYGRADAPAPRP